MGEKYRDSIVGNTYYTFSYNKGNPILKTFTITEEIPDRHPDSKYRYYHTKEGYAQHDTDRHHHQVDGKFTFCDKYIEDGSYEHIYGALNQIIGWKNHYEKKKRWEDLEKLMVIYNSPDFQSHLEDWPAVLID